jgi:hypothetical protein
VRKRFRTTKTQCTAFAEDNNRDNSLNAHKNSCFVGWVKVFRRPTTNVYSAKRVENGNTNSVEYHPNPPFHRAGHTGGGSAEDLDPPYKFETRPHGDDLNKKLRNGSFVFTKKKPGLLPGRASFRSINARAITSSRRVRLCLSFVFQRLRPAGRVAASSTGRIPW